MDGIDDWLERNYFPDYNRLLSSQSTSKSFAELAAGQINDFFVGWVKVAKGTGNVCYDVTSISSYAQQMPSVGTPTNPKRRHVSRTSYVGVFGNCYSSKYAT